MIVVPEMVIEKCFKKSELLNFISSFPRKSKRISKLNFYDPL